MTLRLWPVLGLALAALPLNEAAAANCKTLTGEYVAFGEESTRNYADAALDKAISDWETRTGLKAAPKNRAMACKDYIQFLNEYLCTATATVCR